jgi:hypothetical protein
MKVELVSDLTTFGELDGGDVFLHDDDMYMKIDADEVESNAVDLEDGSLSEIDDDEKVVHFPGATVHVEEPEDDEDD